MNGYYIGFHFSSARLCEEGVLRADEQRREEKMSKEDTKVENNLRLK